MSRHMCWKYLSLWCQLYQLYMIAFEICAIIFGIVHHILLFSMFVSSAFLIQHDNNKLNHDSIIIHIAVQIHATLYLVYAIYLIQWIDSITKMKHQLAWIGTAIWIIIESIMIQFIIVMLYQNADDTSISKAMTLSWYSWHHSDICVDTDYISPPLCTHTTSTSRLSHFQIISLCKTWWRKGYLSDDGFTLIAISGQVKLKIQNHCGIVQNLGIVSILMRELFLGRVVHHSKLFLATKTIICTYP